MAELDHAVTYVAQSQPMSCWAASAAMMMGRTEAEILEPISLRERLRGELDSIRLTYG